ncbi:MAG TPA: HAMP domain-containing sensor histidine kinase [Candidatus Thermoplasmatota archaeon]|nr:HAMP domain-containing sensor histidine kinase [Candidatus Thermoplasmatota archaeon]
MKEGWDLKKILFNRLEVKLTAVFLFVGLVAPTIGVCYFYLIATSLIPQNTIVSAEQQMLLDELVILIILLIAANTTILGFYLSRSFTRPIKELLRTTQELEKGNFSIRANIHTNDELAQLSDAFNRTTITLGKIEEERLQLDKAKSEFLSIVSHELRTPITPLKAQLQMLEQNYFGKLTDRQHESLTVILRNAERLNKIIEDFLEVSRIEAARLKFVFRTTNIEELIRETVHFMEGFAKEKNITLEISTGSLPTIEADPDRISQVLRNLLHNAIKFSPQDSIIQIHAAVKKEYVCFSVKDQGIGLTPDDQIRVFEPFFQVEGTLNRNYGGTGLGLTICRGIIEAQKGKIWVESKQKEGATFFFTIPLVPVKEVEPIKVLFSAKSEIERRLKEEFTSVLGPMGMVEYNELKNKHALDKQYLMEYITSLEDQCILRPASALEFKGKVGNIFGEETNQEKVDETTHRKERRTP